MSNAVALNSASFNAARMIGPAVAGFLIVLVGSGWVFVINAITFVAVLVALVKLRGTRSCDGCRGLPVSAAPSSRASATSAGRPDLVVVFVIVFLIGAFGMNFPIFSSTMAVEFGRGAGEYGVLSSILAIGSLTGALLAARRERARIRVIIVAAAIFGVAVLVSAIMPTYWLFAASTVFIGFGAVTMLTTANGYVQTTTDPLLRGRVMALYMAVVMGGTPIGAPIVGAVANNWGPRWALGVAAVAAGVAALIGLAGSSSARGLRVVRHPTARWMPALALRGCPDRGDRGAAHAPGRRDRADRADRRGQAHGAVTRRRGRPAGDARPRHARPPPRRPAR